MKDRDLSSLKHEILDISQFEFLREADHESPGFLEEMVLGFEFSSKKLLEEMSLSLDKNDKEKVIFLAHKLRGSCGTIGALELMNLARDMEYSVNQLKSKNFIEAIYKKLLKTHKISLRVLKEKLHKGD